MWGSRLTQIQIPWIFSAGNHLEPLALTSSKRCRSAPVRDRDKSDRESGKNSRANLKELGSPRSTLGRNDRPVANRHRDELDLCLTKLQKAHGRGCNW